jgi:hypothetical protein
MRDRAVLITLTLALAASAAGAGGASAATSCPKSGTVATIAGKRTCLATGRACVSSKSSQYRKHGYRCSNGRLKKIKQEF